MSAFIYDQIADLNAFAIRLFNDGNSASSQQCFDSVFEFTRTERLCEIIIGACFEPGNLVRERIKRGQKQGGCLHSTVAHAFEQIKPGHSRHRHVEDETIKLARQCSFQSCLYAVAFFNLKTEAAKILRQK